MAQRARLVAAPDAPDYGWIELSEPRLGPAGGVYRSRSIREGDPGRDFGCVFTLSLNDEESGVELEQVDHYAAEMLGFFEEMARDAAGWKEPKLWLSEFAEVEITAAHRGSDVALGVLMRWPRGPLGPARRRDEDPRYEQERRGVLTVQPEDLEPFAAQMRRLMRRKHGQRWAELERERERERELERERKRALRRQRRRLDPAE